MIIPSVKKAPSVVAPTSRTPVTPLPSPIIPSPPNKQPPVRTTPSNPGGTLGQDPNRDPRSRGAYTEPDSVSSRAHKIAGQDSPFMKQAKTAGKQYAHQRGLLNTSMGAQAAQESVYKSALPFAQADATVEGQHKDRLARSDIAGRELSSAERRAKLERDMRLDIVGQEIGSAEKRAQLERDMRIDLANMDIASKEKLAGMDISSREKVADLARKGNQQAYVFQAVSNAESNYRAKVGSIMANTNLPAEYREWAMEQAVLERDREIGLINSIARYYNPDFTDLKKKIA